MGHDGKRNEELLVVMEGWLGDKLWVCLRRVYSFCVVMEIKWLE